MNLNQRTVHVGNKNEMFTAVQSGRSGFDSLGIHGETSKVPLRFATQLRPIGIY